MSTNAANGAPLLSVEDIHTYYGRIEAVKGVSITVNEGEIVTLIGANGAGKSTTLRSIQGITRPRQGSIKFEGKDIRNARPHQIVKMGISQSPEGRRLFPRMSVRENLEMGAFQRSDRAGIEEDIQHVYQLFPRLQERRSQKAGTLSGGEQQMCAIGRALMARPRLLLLDEITEGLQPSVIDRISGVLLAERRASSIAMLIVEQNVQQVLRVVDRAYLIGAGTIRASGTSAEMLASDTVKEAYLGV